MSCATLVPLVTDYLEHALPAHELVDGDPAGVAIVAQQAAAPQAEPGFQRARFVIHAGMDDTAVVTGLLRPDDGLGTGQEEHADGAGADGRRDGEARPGEGGGADS